VFVILCLRFFFPLPLVKMAYDDNAAVLKDKDDTVCERSLVDVFMQSIRRAVRST
jgi:hypothetical protein